MTPRPSANLGAELARCGAASRRPSQSLRRSLTLNPRDSDVLTEAADVQRQLGRPREALTLYQWALQIDPRRVEALNNLGNAFLELGFAAGGGPRLLPARALEVKPDDAQVLCNLGNALRELGQLQEALEISRRAISLAPQLAMAHNNLGLLLAGRGEPAEAAASYREALRLRPAYPQAMSNLAQRAA